MNSISTIEDLRKQARAEYEQETPRPEPPKPPILPRPAVIQIGQAHAWLEVSDTSTTKWGHSQSSPDVRFYLVSREDDKAQFEGVLKPDELDGLMQQLEQIKANLVAKQAYLKADDEYRDQMKEWEARRDQYVNAREVEFQRAAKEAAKAKKD